VQPQSGLLSWQLYGHVDVSCYDSLMIEIKKKLNNGRGSSLSRALELICVSWTITLARTSNHTKMKIKLQEAYL